MKSFIQPRPWLAAVIGLTSVLSCVTVSAQTAPSFPGKAITMVVPFPPGGVADIVARPVAEAMGRELGQAVVIENKPGAGGGIGMGLVAKAKPDGYTVLMALSSLSVIPEADALVGRPAMYGHTDLRPIARYTADPTVLAVRADAPLENRQRLCRRCPPPPQGHQLWLIRQLRNHACAHGDLGPNQWHFTHPCALHRRGPSGAGLVGRAN